MQCRVASVSLHETDAASRCSWFTPAVLSGQPRTTEPGRSRKASTSRLRIRRRRRTGSSPRSSGRIRPPGLAWISGSSASQAARRVHVWAVEGDIDADAVVSNEFELEWPPRSGVMVSFPEVDRAEWVPIATARRKLVKGQVGLSRPAPRSSERAESAARPAAQAVAELERLLEREADPYQCRLAPGRADQAKADGKLADHAHRQADRRIAGRLRRPGSRPRHGSRRSLGRCTRPVPWSGRQGRRRRQSRSAASMPSRRALRQLRARALEIGRTVSAGQLRGGYQMLLSEEGQLFGGMSLR